MIDEHYLVESGLDKLLYRKLQAYLFSSKYFTAIRLPSASSSTRLCTTGTVESISSGSMPAGQGMLTGLARSCMTLAAQIMAAKRCRRTEHACLPISCRLLCAEGLQWLFLLAFTGLQDCCAQI